MRQGLDAIINLQKECITRADETGKPPFMRENEEGKPCCGLMDCLAAEDIAKSCGKACKYIDLVTLVPVNPNPTKPFTTNRPACNYNKKENERKE